MSIIEQTTDKQKGFRYGYQSDGHEIASAYLYILYNSRHIRPFGFIEYVIVDKEFRGQGIGSRLVRAMVSKAREENCYKIILTSRHDKDKVHALYNKLGFKEWARSSDSIYNYITKQLIQKIRRYTHMKDILNNVGIVILAAGKGTRLNCSDTPKVLLPIGGRPVLSYILEELGKHGIEKQQIFLVVGFQAQQVENAFGSGYNYILQKERRGTAHAAHTGEAAMPQNIDTMLVLNGDDTAFYTFKSLSSFIDRHRTSECDVSLLTSEPRDAQGLGRVVRDDQGKMTAVVEKENMKPEHHEIREISTGTFCFKERLVPETLSGFETDTKIRRAGLTRFYRYRLNDKRQFAGY